MLNQLRIDGLMAQTSSSTKDVIQITNSQNVFINHDPIMKTHKVFEVENKKMSNVQEFRNFK